MMPRLLWSDTEVQYTVASLSQPMCLQHVVGSWDLCHARMLYISQGPASIAIYACHRIVPSIAPQQCQWGIQVPSLCPRQQWHG